MSSDPHPMVDAIDIIRLVGKGAYDRAKPYARGRAVITLEWRDHDRVLVGEVQGTEPRPYRCRIEMVPAGKGLSRPAGGTCSCPMAFDCKHVAATLLASNAARLKEKQAAAETRAPSGQAAWKRALSPLASPPVGGRSPGERRAPMGLQFEMREQQRRDRWAGATSRPASARSSGTLRLGIRPVMRSASGNWVKSNLSWQSLAYPSGRGDLDPDQLHWFAQLSALSRSRREAYLGQDADWLYLDDFASPLLWNLLDEAARPGIPLLSSKKDGVVTLGGRARVALDATDTSGDLRLAASVSIDGRPFEPATCGAIGPHGVYGFGFDPTTIILAPTDAPLGDEHRRLLGRDSTVVVPAADVSEFFASYYPALRQRIGVTSSDGSVSFPEILPPTLLLTVTFEPKHTIRLDWQFDYQHGRMSLHPHRDDTGTRDPAAERQLLEIAGHPQPQAVLRDLDAAEFAHRELPRLEVTEAIRVERVGDAPDYRELTEAPKLTVSTVETEQRDWFDLGVIVTIEGKEIPFGKLFAAMAKGRTRLLLVDGSYFSLKHPALERLQQLIDEAGGLDEWQAGPRISRYQASLWHELDELADETIEAEAWRASVDGLRDITRIDPVELPSGLNATLRPYQFDGFRWLAFLWQHRLGGVLADDMGLGKTLQTIALIAHAKQTGERRPFLVVAPTSVVSNWAAESARFAPGLSVASVTRTEAKAGVKLADRISGADVVVTSYTLFRLDFEQYQGVEWAGLILDEAQFVKNRASRANVCARELAVAFKLAITGTPMENNLMELHALFSIAAPGLFSSARRFADEYQRPIEVGGSGELLARLRRRIRPLMMRRTKELVASDLPAKQEQVLQIELGPRHRTLYDTFLQRERQKLLGLIEDLDRNRFIVFRSLTLLRMLSLDASLVDEKYAAVPSSKLDALFEQLDDVLAEGHRALVFSQFTSFLKKVAARLDEQGIAHSYLDGATTGRAAVIDRFKQGDAPVFLISLKAGGFGLNLTEADYVFLLDPWWNPATEAQAVDRTHRIGQTRNVMVYRMIASGTIEEKVMALKERKARLFDSVMDDDAVFSAALTADDIRDLLEPVDKASSDALPGRPHSADHGISEKSRH